MQNPNLGQDPYYQQSPPNLQNENETYNGLNSLNQTTGRTTEHVRDSNMHDIYENAPIYSQSKEDDQSKNPEVFKNTETINLKQENVNENELNDTEAHQPNTTEKEGNDNNEAHGTSMGMKRTSMVIYLRSIFN
jgi:hypothetical protein